MSGRDRYIIASEIIGLLKHGWETGESLDGYRGPLNSLVKRYDEAPKPSFEIIGMLCQCESCRKVRSGEIPPRWGPKRPLWFEERGITEEEWEEQQRQKREEKEYE